MSFLSGTGAGVGKVKSASQSSQGEYGDSAIRRIDVPTAHNASIFPQCANTECSSGWLHLWRSRSIPVFEGGWCCSPQCTAVRLQKALDRELNRDMRSANGRSYRHRIPLGLSMLEKGWITAEDLRQAVDMQRASGGQIGRWLVRNGSVTEDDLTRALAMQWSCPVLGPEVHDGEGLAPVLPRLFVEALRVVPLRTSAQRILYLGYESRPDLVLAMALERMTGLRVESGVVKESAFRSAHAQAIAAHFPPVELLEAASASALARVLTNALESSQPRDARLVRVHDFLWLRLWVRRQSSLIPRKEEIRDLVCTIRGDLLA